MGMNFIVDKTSTEGDDLEKGNGVGKTTTLRLIDLCLGATDRKRIYTIGTTKTPVINLKNYINDHKVRVKLTLYNTEKKIVLEVDLFERGKQFINDEFYNMEEYPKKLKEEIFQVRGDEKPTFRQLIPKFVRVNLGGESKADIFKYLK